MSDYRYTIILQPDAEEGGYAVTVPELPGIVTQGETFEEAVAMARDVMKLQIEALHEDGAPVPRETEHPHAVVVAVAA